MDICIKCKTRPIYIKSRGLCKSCVSLFYLNRAKERERAGRVPLGEYRENKVQYKSEIEFIKNFFAHKNWTYQPAYFRLNSGGYSPDFYDGERNIFIEVSGTFQAFYGNRDKYREFIATYPQINFEIRTTKGTIVPLTATEGTFPTDERK